MYRLAINISSLWNIKAKKWIQGRKKKFETVQKHLQDKPGTAFGSIWIHCSSLGEFEQGKPVIEKIRKQYPAYKLILTFFSPSGYEAKKNYGGVDHIFYLPMDSKKNAKRFLDLVNPSLIIFIKYDYWYYYLNETQKRKINCLLVSAVFRNSQIFFKWYGTLQRKMLNCFTEIFVQDEKSKDLLEKINIENVVLSGDTRFDTVIATAEKFESIPVIENFIEGKKSIVAGSTWKDDEEFLQKLFLKLKNHDLKLIIAPHEINGHHLNELKKLFPASLKYSELNTETSFSNILIIDNIGMLSRLYKYAYITYVGGGFTKDGVHNVLEAAIYGKPVVFGKNYKKYKEAIELIQCEGAKSFSGSDELNQIISDYLIDENAYKQSCIASMKYVIDYKGATEKVMTYINEKRLLTS